MPQRKQESPSPVWRIHLDPQLPDLSDAPMDEIGLIHKIELGRVKPDSWLSHPSHTSGRIIPALRIPHLRKWFRLVPTK